MSVGFVFHLCAWSRGPVVVEPHVAVAVGGSVSGSQSGTSRILPGVLYTFGVDVLTLRRENIMAQCTFVLLGLEGWKRVQ